MQNPTSKLYASLLCLGLAMLMSDHTRSSATAPPNSRKFSFTYQVHVPAADVTNGKYFLWLPLPQDDKYQKIEDLHIDSPAWFKQGREGLYDNAYAEFHPSVKQLQTGFDASIHFVAIRYEHKVALPSAASSDAASNASKDPALQRYLEPDNLIPLNGPIAELTKEHTDGDRTDLAKAQHIYDYVVATMRYDKTGEGWGRGDAIWACTSKRGNCTDFHSLLIGMMRASGIPARFEIGFPLPIGKSEGDIPGYHCWAEFYLNDVGWIPVDASEAWKNPAKREYFFGANDENRVFFTYGRDIRLSSDQKGAPLNYFIYPYAELDGKPVSGLQARFSFHDLEPVQAGSTK